MPRQTPGQTPEPVALPGAPPLHGGPSKEQEWREATTGQGPAAGSCRLPAARSRLCPRAPRRPPPEAPSHLAPMRLFCSRPAARSSAACWQHRITLLHLLGRDARLPSASRWPSPSGPLDPAPWPWQPLRLLPLAARFAQTASDPRARALPGHRCHLLRTALQPEAPASLGTLRGQQEGTAPRRPARPGQGAPPGSRDAGAENPRGSSEEGAGTERRPRSRGSPSRSPRAPGRGCVHSPRRRPSPHAEGPVLTRAAPEPWPVPRPQCWTTGARLGSGRHLRPGSRSEHAQQSRGARRSWFPRAAASYAPSQSALGAGATPRGGAGPH